MDAYSGKINPPLFEACCKAIRSVIVSYSFIMWLAATYGKLNKKKVKSR